MLVSMIEAVVEHSQQGGFMRDGKLTQLEPAGAGQHVHHAAVEEARRAPVRPEGQPRRQRQAGDARRQFTEIHVAGTCTRATADGAHTQS
ncbi:hypothetical protein EVAR_84263_1 [Eumeta japonica]|uniref:Uncharacterized protein n=1 Tax=Eumeta variegata TaxID=151549 RepID=A0A4C1WU95_EUMVA|nr:hypothetical protein EVAR_84263_1 [Eumeta japonica]